MSDRGRHPKPSTTPRDTSITGDATPPDGVLTIWKFNTYVLEADEMTGPWRMVAYLNTRFKSSPDLRPR